MKRPYTVFGVYEDDHAERFAVYVTADDAHDAENVANADHDDGRTMIIATVVAGHVPMFAKEDVPAPVADLAEVRRRGYETQVAVVRVLYKPFLVPLRCPACKADLKKPGALQQWDYHDRVWNACVPGVKTDVDRGRFGVKVDEVGGTRPPFDMSGTVSAFALTCVGCQHELWNGYVEIASDGVAKHRRMPHDKRRP